MAQDNTGSPKKRPRGRPRAADADEKRDKILGIAAKLFAEQGFNKTSFASIAEAMDMTLAGVTHYFPTKIDVLLEVLKYRDREMFPNGFPVDEADPLSVLNRLMERDVGRGAAMTRMFLMISTEAISKSHPANGWFDERYKTVFGGLSTGLRKLQDKGLIHAEVNCGQEAAMILAMMEGLQLRWLRANDDLNAVDLFHGYLEKVKARILV